MDTVRKGNLILKEVTSPDGGARLIGMLQKIFPKATPEQLQGLLSRPKPLVLSKNISEATARKLVELLQPHAGQIQFLVSFHLRGRRGCLDRVRFWSIRQLFLLVRD